MSFDPGRHHFPALQREHRGQPVLYADNPGGTQVPQQVADAMADYLLHRNANVHGGFATSDLTDETVAGARAAMADLLNAPSPESIVFGPNMTSLTFQVAHAFGRTVAEGDEIIITRLDHDANYTPWLTLAEQGATVHQIPLRPEDVTLDVEALLATLSARTRLVALGHASNAVGTLTPLATLIPQIRQQAPEALIFVDAVQSVPHLPVDVQALDADLLVCSAYKFFGPHVGILSGKAGPLAELPVYKVRASSAEAPDRWETGTKNHEGLAGVTAAVDYLAGHGTGETRRERLADAMARIQQYEQTLSAQLIAGLQGIPTLRLWGISDAARLHERVPTVALTSERHTPQALSARLAAEGIFAWAGHYYALEVMESLDLVPHGALRLGLAHYNTPDEVDRLVETLATLVAG